MYIYIYIYDIYIYTCVCFSFFSFCVDLPKVTCLTPSQTVYLDANVQIECGVISSTYANITWLHNGKSLSEKKKSLVKIDRLSCGQTLKIKFAGRDDRGKYTCAATNKFGTVNKTCSLNVTGMAL